MTHQSNKHLNTYKEELVGGAEGVPHRAGNGV